jgi:prepilin-type N-terminal cleavage/methylation domain-containing protein
LKIANARSSELGFTLLEVLIASAIFGIGSLGVLALVTTSIKLNASSRNFAEASLVGQWKLDLLQVEPVATSADFLSCAVNTPMTSMCHSNGTVLLAGAKAALTLANIGAPIATVDTGLTPGARYQLIWSATALPAPDLGLVAIDVTVFWPHDRNFTGLAAIDPLFIDCPATPGACYRLDFHTYRRP